MLGDVFTFAKRTVRLDAVVNHTVLFGAAPR